MAPLGSLAGVALPARAADSVCCDEVCELISPCFGCARSGHGRVGVKTSLQTATASTSGREATVGADRLKRRTLDHLHGRGSTLGEEFARWPTRELATLFGLLDADVEPE